MAEADPVTSPQVPDSFTAPDVEPPLPRRDLADVFEDARGRSTGAAGVHLPERDYVALSPRHVHHNDQLSVLDERGIPLDTKIVPFVADTYPLYDDGDYAGEGVEFEYPRSAGGAFQYVSRHLPGATLTQHGIDISVGELYQAVYAVRLVDAPGDADARVSFLDPDSERLLDQHPGLRDEITVRPRNATLRTFYDELRFAGRLPDPRVDKSVSFDR